MTAPINRQLAAEIAYYKAFDNAELDISPDEIGVSEYVIQLEQAVKDGKPIPVHEPPPGIIY